MAQALALFDFDGTLIPGDSIVAYTRFALRRGRMRPGAYLLSAAHGAGYLLGLEDENQSKSHALAFRGRLSPADRDELDRAFAGALLARVYPAARARLEEHRQAGRVALLVTASPECYMRFVGPALGFRAVLATPVSDENAVHGNCKGEEKIRRVMQWLRENGVDADFSASFAYGDSKSDLPMLKLCGHPVLVNPKPALLRSAPHLPREAWRYE